MEIPSIKQLIQKNLKKERYAKIAELMPYFKNEKAQKFTTILLTISASIILVIFAVSPTLSTIVNLQKQLDDDKFVEQSMEEKINNLSILQQKYQSLKNDLPLVFSAVPTSPELTLFLGELQSLANETNIKIISFQSLPVGVSDSIISQKKFSAFDFTITVQGDYNSMANFLEKISNFSRIVTISNISISKTTGVNTSYLQLSVKGSSYFKK